VAGGEEAWRTLLAEPGDETQMKELRRATYAGQPFGNEEFIDEMRGRREDAAASRARNVSPQLGLAFASAAY